MGKWSPDSLTHISTMKKDDFRHNEKSVTIEKSSVGKASICFFDKDGHRSVLANDIQLQLGSVVDTTFMSVKALQDFYRSEISDAKRQGVLYVK